MRILIDLRSCQAPPPRGGVATYAEQMTRALLLAAGPQPSTPSRLTFILYANGAGNIRQHLPALGAPEAQWQITHWPNKLISAAALLRANTPLPSADVIWLPNLNFIPRLPRRTKLIVTVHDLSFEHFPDSFTVKQRLWHRAIQPRKLLARADSIVTVSRTTKRDLAETYGIPEKKMHVIYPGMGSAQSSTISPLDTRGKRIGGSFPYLLSLSELSPRKNIDGLIAAFERLPQRQRSNAVSLHLIIAGVHGSAERSLRRHVARSSRRDRIHLIGSTTEQEKHALLARASCFVFPSLWEGFGFPPLEAMLHGIPVVASTGGSLPEILDDAALLVDPLDPSAIAHAIDRVCSDQALRQELIVRGRARSERYQWTSAGDQLLKLLQSH